MSRSSGCLPADGAHRGAAAGARRARCLRVGREKLLPQPSTTRSTSPFAGPAPACPGEPRGAGGWDGALEPSRVSARHGPGQQQGLVPSSRHLICMHLAPSVPHGRGFKIQSGLYVLGGAVTAQAPTSLAHGPCCCSETCPVLQSGHGAGSGGTALPRVQPPPALLLRPSPGSRQGGAESPWCVEQGALAGLGTPLQAAGTCRCPRWGSRSCSLPAPGGRPAAPRFADAAFCAV